MLLAHLSDIHLGYRQYYRQTPLGINQREADVANAFRDAISGVIAAKPDIVVIAGDLFHTVRPTNQSIVFSFQQFQRLRDGLPQAQVILIAGNHDTPRATETGSILKLFSELGVHVVIDQAEYLPFADLGVTVLAVPHQAVVAPDRARFRPDGSDRAQVMVIHGEVEGLFPLERWWAEPGGAILDPAELADPRWRYVALGHYHVMRRFRPNVWYSGALDYVTPNPWGELTEQTKTGVKAKGWLLVDISKPEIVVTPQFIEPPRKLIDLKPVLAGDLAASELDRLIEERLSKVSGGIKDKLVRLVVRDIPRHVARELNHSAIRAAKASALHFHLDLRRPEVQRTIGVGAPGARQTLTDILRSYLSRRPLPERIGRDQFVNRGVELLESVTFEPEVQI